MEHTKPLTRLTDEQRRFWNENGYVIIPSALSAAEIAVLSDAFDRLERATREQTRNRDGFLIVRPIIDKDDAFLNLIDHPNHLGIVCDLMGANIQVTESVIMSRPPTNLAGTRWHDDGPSPYRYPRVNGVMPLIQLRVGWFLHDIDDSDMGNFVLVPGSHVNGFPNGAVDAHRLTARGTDDLEDVVSGVPGALQLTLKAGDAFLMHNGLWHAVSRNTSGVTRRNLYYMYGPIWARIGDYKEPPETLLAKCDPIKRQLAGGWMGPNPEFYAGMAPEDEWAPLVGLFHGKSVSDVEHDENAIHESR